MDAGAINDLVAFTKAYGLAGAVTLGILVLVAMAIRNGFTLKVNGSPDARRERP